MNREAVERKDMEIMAPAGSWEALAAAINAGADSIYFGVEQLNMRAKSSVNFTLEDIEKVVKRAKEREVKAYLTVNTVLYDNEIEQMREIVDHAKKAGIDAVIVADQAAISYAAEVGMEVHISTQLNVSNLETVKFYAKWADVVVLARELTLKQIEYIYRGIESQNITGPSGERIKIEMFAHGAMCMAISGRCYLSLHETGCSANRGECRQICRREYRITDIETGEQLDTDGRYILSPKDLATIGFVDKMMEAGVRVLKIEGRARSAEYVKSVVECYDQAVRAVEAGEYTKEKIKNWTQRLERVFNRGLWGGYYLGAPVAEVSQRYGSSATKRKVYVGKVTNYFKKIDVAEILIEAATMRVGEEVVIIGETTGVVEMVVEQIIVEKREVEGVEQGQRCSIKTTEILRRGDKLYKMVEAE